MIRGLVRRGSDAEMIYGIGIDIVRIERIKRAVERWGDRFLLRIFTEGEILHCFKKKNPYLSLSVRFAAKEALIKAIAGEVSVSFTDIEVQSSDRGKPLLMVKGPLQSFFSARSIAFAHVTLSHETEYGIACVVLEEQR